MKVQIRELRNFLNMNQTEFGKKIGVKQGSVAAYESGARTPIDAVITSICREFNVNEDWLRTGDGDMFIALAPDEEFEMVWREIKVTDSKNSEFIKRIMLEFWKLDDEQRKTIVDLIENIAGK